tara:strand:- start:1640 stop:2347 length:708 start_codon:yes stop_codon:yes gene_type:complete
MSILPVVQQNLELKIEKVENIIDDVTDDQSEDEPEPIINVRERKKAVREEIFDIKEKEVEEVEEVEDFEEDEVVEQPVLKIPEKRKPARNYEAGYRIGEYEVITDKRGNKRWQSDTVLAKARERMLKGHQDGTMTQRGKARNPQKDELKSVKQLEQANEDMLKKYQEDLVKVVQKASFDAVEAYDIKRKARKAEKKATQNANQVNNELHNKLAGIQQQRQRPSYGQPGYFNQCWD